MSATTSSAGPSTLTVRELRRRWKPHKQRLADSKQDHPPLVRFHRACSWLARVEDMGENVDYDLALISQWIAFNSLYGQWDEIAHQPVPDRECWRVFVDRILDLDSGGLISEMLTQNKQLVISLLEDEYLSKFFWEEPGRERANKARRKKFQAQGWFIDGSWKLIVEQVLERIYLMRCQLTHGAATYGGKLNRTSLRRCSTMMGHLLPTMLLVLIDQGADEDWGIMCYPPIHGGGTEMRLKPR